MHLTRKLSHRSMYGPSPAAASLLLLRAGDIETNPEPHCYACGNPVRHGTSTLRCSTANCSIVSHKQFTCSGLPRSNLINLWQCPPHGGPGPPCRQFRQQQLSATAADFLSAEVPGPSPAMPRTVRHKSTLRGGAAVLPHVKVGGVG